MEVDVLDADIGWPHEAFIAQPFFLDDGEGVSAGECLPPRGLVAMIVQPIGNPVEVPSLVTKFRNQLPKLLLVRRIWWYPKSR